MKIKVSAIAANVRQTPSTLSRVMTMHQQGTELVVYNKVSGQVVNSSDVWYQVDKGYIHSSVVIISQSLKPQLAAFVKLHNAKYRDWDGYYGAQCMDLMHYWVDYLKLTPLPPAPTARDEFVNFRSHPNFTKHLNTEIAIPLPGDILFWDKPWDPITRTGSLGAIGITGWAGHVAVFVDGDVNKVTSFDQNWPTGSPCHVQAHSYRGIMGWLRPNV